MPRQRQRIVYCDCFDCRDRPDQEPITKEQLDAAIAVARQEPPPKALLVYASGILLDNDGATNLEACSLPHCNLIVRDGNLGLLAVRQATGSDSDPALSELAQLLGVYEEVKAGAAGGADAPALPSLAQRFKGMRAAFASTHPAARALAARAGMEHAAGLGLGPGPAAGDAPAPPEQSAQGQGEAGAAGSGAATSTTDIGGGGGGSGGSGSGGSGSGGGGGWPGALQGLPEPGACAAAAAAELGAAEGAAGRDLLLLHLDVPSLLRQRGLGGASSGASAGAAAEQGGGTGAAAGGAADGGKDDDEDAAWGARLAALEWVDALVRGLLARQEVRERVMLVLVLSPTGRPMPAVPGQGGAAAGALLLPGGGGGPAVLDPSAAVVTPRNAVQQAALQRLAPSEAAAAAAGAAAPAALPAGLAVLDAAADGTGAGAAGTALVSRPMQSFEACGLERVATDGRAPALVARRLPGVVRRDRAERLGYREALTAGGQGCILIDRLLHEVAYKIARAPKYGA